MVRVLPRFNDLFYRGAEPVYFTFDVLALDGKDLRNLPLIRAKLEGRHIGRPKLDIDEAAIVRDRRLENL